MDLTLYTTTIQGSVFFRSTTEGKWFVECTRLWWSVQKLGGLGSLGLPGSEVPSADRQKPEVPFQIPSTADFVHFVHFAYRPVVRVFSC